MIRARRTLNPRRPSGLLLMAVAVAIPVSSFAQVNNANPILRWADPGPQRETDRPKITPPDVFARVSLARAEIELIRFAMGKPKDERQEIGVTGVYPREVYFQAITMFHKANRLSFELIREVASIPEPPSTDIQPADVMAVLDAALNRIRLVGRKMKITTVNEELTPDASKTPTHVFRAIVQANRQLNLLLEERFAPADVFQEMTLAVGYAARLRACFPGGRIPEPPELVAGKQPRDVYRKIIDCFVIIRDIAKVSNLETLELHTNDDHIGRVTPSDVYDIASLLVSELAYIHSKLKGSTPPRPAFYPGRKFPSHVHQRAGILERQLLELRRLVKDEPDWLLQPNVGQR